MPNSSHNELTYARDGQRTTVRGPVRTPRRRSEGNPESKDGFPCPHLQRKMQILHRAPGRGPSPLPPSRNGAAGPRRELTQEGMAPAGRHFEGADLAMGRSAGAEAPLERAARPEGHTAPCRCDAARCLPPNGVDRTKATDPGWAAARCSLAFSGTGTGSPPAHSLLPPGPVLAGPTRLLRRPSLFLGRLSAAWGRLTTGRGGPPTR